MTELQRSKFVMDAFLYTAAKCPGWEPADEELKCWLLAASVMAARLGPVADRTQAYQKVGEMASRLVIQADAILGLRNLEDYASGTHWAARSDDEIIRLLEEAVPHVKQEVTRG